MTLSKLSRLFVKWERCPLCGKYCLPSLQHLDKLFFNYPYQIPTVNVLNKVFGEPEEKYCSKCLKIAQDEKDNEERRIMYQQEHCACHLGNPPCLFCTDYRREDD